MRHGIPVIAVVGNDAGWTQIAREQVKMLHDDVGTVLARTRLSRGRGGLRRRRHSGDERRRGARGAGARARDRATAGKPVLVNVWLDKTDFREGSISM